MARQKILYFTAGSIPTGPELAEIAAIPLFDVLVRNAAGNPLYGTKIEPCDYVAGSIPESYSEIDEYSAAVGLAGTQAIVEDGQVLDVDGGGTVELTIADGVITGVAYTAP